MKTSRLLLTVVILIAGYAFTPLNAASIPRNARLEISGNTADKIDIDIEAVEGGKATPANWAGTDPNKQYVIEFPANQGWKQASLTFRPHKSGKVYFGLMSNYCRRNNDTKELYAILICYDDIKVDGATLRNGSFEETDSDGKPVGWSLNDAPTSLPPIDERNRASVLTGDAVDGSKYARVWHNSRFSQSLDVEADKPVTITFSYRYAGGE